MANQLVKKEWESNKLEYDKYLLTSKDVNLLTYDQYFRTGGTKNKHYDPIPYYESNEIDFLTYDPYPEEYYEQKEKERNNAIDKYINEFDLLNYKYVKNMSGFKDNELSLWKIVLSDIYSEWAEIGDINGDLFDEDKNKYIYEREIQIRKWLWTHNEKSEILIDMAGWPGDNGAGGIFINNVFIPIGSNKELGSTKITPEAGGIFINNKLILISSDQELGSTKITPEAFLPRIPAFEHIRTQMCTCEYAYDENEKYTIHERCLRVKEKLDY